MHAFVAEILEDFNKQFKKCTYNLIRLLHLEKLYYYIFYNFSP